ncbi:hypothetical protein NQ318_018955 [Aromia moschata]|uniref:PiggyBac transposable element-derived protein domain-containing protein n=1 Tax=Aromia moschata TaxID=1265417 RepID=A0AAV8ZJ08_9CUCU|nr:hypothetical protein NQ318_018955 [Aromia moschata]
MASRKKAVLGKRYNPDIGRDAEALLQIFEELSDIDLSDDEEGDVENYHSEPVVETVRVGADKVGPRTIETEEVIFDDAATDDEDDLPLSELAKRIENSKEKAVVTSKENIKWSRTHFQNLNIDWNESEKPEPEALNPLHYFQKYLDESQFEQMATFTNIYAHQQDIIVKPTHTAEIKALFGLHIAAGCLKFPKTRLFWDRALQINLFRETMSRDRFFQLRSNLHCVNNLEIPDNNTDRLIKVRPLYDGIRRRCLELDLEQNLCIDEQIVPFRGRLSIKQYVKGKPTPWGVKIFLLCGRSGIAYDFLIYQGSTTPLSPENLKSFGLGASVVLHLSERIEKEGHLLFYDNYFSSYPLLEILRTKKNICSWNCPNKQIWESSFVRGQGTKTEG